MKRKITAKARRQVQAKRDNEKKLQATSNTFPVASLPQGAMMGKTTATPNISIPVQPKLTIGQVGDKYEQEADTVAAQVVQQINSPVQKQAEEEATVQRKHKSELSNLKEEVASQDLSAPLNNSMFGAPVQRQPQIMKEDAANPGFEVALGKTLGKGQSLDDKTQVQMSNAMGADFSGVTIHKDADPLCDQIGARAFTTGSDVYFKQGEYQPENQQGQELLAHELTHVVQQGQGGQVQMMVQRKPLKPSVVNEASKHNLSWSELEEFSKTEYNFENLDFLKQCETYDNAPSLGMMSLIYKNYVKVNSSKEVNLSSSVRGSISQSIETELAKPKDQKQPLVGIFDSAQKEIAFICRQIVIRASTAKKAKAQEEYDLIMSNLEAAGLA